LKLYVNVVTSTEYSLQGVSLQVLTASVREARLEVSNFICGLVKVLKVMKGCA